MRKVKTVNDMIVVVPFDKPKKAMGDNPFANLVVSNNLGTVKYSSYPEFPEGTTVYFGGLRETLIIEGVEVLAMKMENVIGVIIEE
jgi:hypothetical protein